MHISGGMRWVLRLGTAVTLAFIYIPLIVIVIYAFNESRSQAWPIDGFTLEWFDKAFNNPGVRDAFWTSLKAATGATADRPAARERSPRWRSPATASSAATRSRSCSSSRSRCPGS